MKTNSIKTLLIALDYDPTAQKVAEEGFSLAKAMNDGNLAIFSHVSCKSSVSAFKKMCE